MSFREAAIEVLRVSKKAMNAKEITDRILSNEMVATVGKTPDRTVAALMYAEMKYKGKQSSFILCGKGIFGLRELSDIYPTKLSQPKGTNKPKSKKDVSSKQQNSKNMNSTLATTRSKRNIKKVDKDFVSDLPVKKRKKKRYILNKDTISPNQMKGPQQQHDDEYSYLYLRYYLDINRRQEEQDLTVRL